MVSSKTVTRQQLNVLSLQLMNSVHYIEYIKPAHAYYKKEIIGFFLYVWWQQEKEILHDQETLSSHSEIDLKK